MTAGEFAKKYGIDYQVVRAATFRTVTRAECGWMLDYPETELKKAVKEELTYKLVWHRDRLTRIAGWMASLDRTEKTVTQGGTD